MANSKQGLQNQFLDISGNDSTVTLDTVNSQTFVLGRATAVTGAVSVTGAITATTTVTATGNISGADITASGDISGVDITATGNLAGVDLTASGNISAANVTSTGNLTRSVTAGITASVTQTQGQQPLTADINEISTCANAGDVVTLPAAAAGLSVVIINNGAASCDVYPASGDNAGGGVDTAVALAAGAKIHYVAYDTTNWVAI